MNKMHDRKHVRPVNSHVGKRIEQRMNELDLRLEEFAALSGLDTAEANRIIQGTGYIDPSQLFNVAHALHVSVNFFFEKYNDPKNKEVERLMKAFLKIKEPASREKYLRLLEKQSQGQDDDTSCR